MEDCNQKRVTLGWGESEDDPHSLSYSFSEASLLSLDATEQASFTQSLGRLVRSINAGRSPSDQDLEVIMRVDGASLHVPSGDNSSMRLTTMGEYGLTEHSIIDGA